jgi:predicted XRE-type DNA-binding protein
VGEPVIDSSGNVFSDLGFDPGDAAILELRARLFTDLRASLLSSGWSEVEAAETLQIGRGRIADLMSGKWDKFSLETLIILLARSGKSVRLVLAA